MPKTTKSNRKLANTQPEKERTLVSFDWAMKHILRDKANFDVLEGFLTTLLGREVQVIALLESEGNQKREDNKFNRVDLAVKDDLGEQILVEIQHDLDLHYFKRLLFGTAKLITDHLKVGKPYAHIQKVISISILYFQMEEHSEDYLYHGFTEFYGWHTKRPMKRQLSEQKQRERQREKQQAPHPDRLWMENDAPAIFPEYYLIDVVSFQNIIQSGIDEWVYLFKNSEIRQEFQSKNIQSARDKLDYMKMSESEQRAYEQYMFNRASEESVLRSAHLQGVAEGKAEGIIEGKAVGIIEGKREAARKMRAKGWDVAAIVEMTGLSEAEIALC